MLRLWLLQLPLDRSQGKLLHRRWDLERWLLKSLSFWQCWFCGIWTWLLDLREHKSGLLRFLIFGCTLTNAHVWCMVFFGADWLYRLGSMNGRSLWPVDNHSFWDYGKLSLRVLIVCLLLLEAFKRWKERMLPSFTILLHRMLRAMPLKIWLLLLQSGRVNLMCHFLSNLLIVAFQLEHSRMLAASWEGLKSLLLLVLLISELHLIVDCSSLLRCLGRPSCLQSFRRFSLPS